MATILKIYQTKLIHEVLTAACFREVKSNINKTFSSLTKQNIADDQILVLVADTLKELKALHQSKLSYDQHANVITAKVYLKELQLQMFNVIN